MESIRYDEQADALITEAGTPFNKLQGGSRFFGSLSDLGPIALVSVCKAATELRRKTRYKSLRLAWTVQPREVFEHSIPPAELVELSSDGDHVLVTVSLFLYDHEGVPRGPDDASKLLREAIKPALASHGAVVEHIHVSRFIPGQNMRQARIDLKIEHQRRTVSEAWLFGRSIRHAANNSVAILENADGVIAALRSAPTLLLGRFESDWLEAKRQPYNLDQEPQKVELSKDVAALANATGGIIVFGYSTSRSPDGDVLSSVRPFEAAKLDGSRYLQVLHARIYPMPERLKIETVGSNDVLAYIRVPNQPSELRPFMLRQTVTKGRIRTNSLTVPVRVGADVAYSSPEAIHSLIVAGRAALAKEES